MIQIFRQTDRQEKPALYCEVATKEKALELFDKIKNQSAFKLIGEGEKGIYGKATDNFSVPFCLFFN